jgi:hypothetical protein
MKRFRPLHDRVLVKRIETEDKDSWWYRHPGYGEGETR